MFITNVAPLTKIPRSFPQTLSYFTSQRLERGSLVLIPLQKKNVEAIVLSQKNVKDVKQEIKKANFELKPIFKIIEKTPVLDEYQLRLAKWISNYYFASFGKTLKLFLMANKKSQKLQSQQFKLKQQNKQIQPILYFSSPDFLPKEEIKEAILKEKEILFLVPERNKIDFWRKKLKEEKIDNENIKIASRSGLFLKFFNLGLIIVSEANNENYKEEREPRFFAPDVATILAKFWGSKLVFLSCFPSVENYFEAKGGKIIWKRAGNEKEIKRIEINPSTGSGNNGKRNDIVPHQKTKQAWSPFTPETLEKIEECLKQQKKILLFLNRKGAATTLLCQDCGWQKFCPNCGVPMTYHKKTPNSKTQNPKLVCHYCGFERPVPEYCENCNSWRLTTLGIGVEKVEEEIKKQFPKAKVFRLDREISPKEKEQKAILKEFFEKGDVLISTSLVFSYLLSIEDKERFDLTVFVSFGSQLALPDFRFEEKLYRQIENLIFLTKEEFILQNYSFKRNILNKSSEEFYKESLREREQYFYPPFAKLIKLTLEHKDQNKAKKEAYVLKEKLEKWITTYSLQQIAQILGPAPAFISKIKGKYRWNILIKLANFHESKHEFSRIKNQLLMLVSPNWKIDIDPIMFF
ncbi:MAG TPA: primosomal protein N' [Candidatus Pacearchaeota archaeon]|nr:primosomal protein N' [Candidatus Pacearchaeota archaeon]HOK94325.1 primosomal protein N' [Candidatus Pacearchaeota archaeon]HPO75319.1 primosomal protein N' [Candidatus Pacearchaeota archaeon]